MDVKRHTIETEAKWPDSNERLQAALRIAREDGVRVIDWRTRPSSNGKRWEAEIDVECTDLQAVIMKLRMNNES